MLHDLNIQIIEQARLLGASLVGIAGGPALRDSPSRRHEGLEVWPEGAGSVLVLALAHPMSQPELDWWDNQTGGTPGNRELIRIADSLAQWLQADLSIEAHSLSYHAETSGVFLKDAAVLAGVGIIGQNNLLLTEAYGPRVRLRALALDADLAPTGPLDFAPCAGCDAPCWLACPQQAFEHEVYERARCQQQMRADEANAFSGVEVREGDALPGPLPYCRACEFACPVGRDRG
jgi:epoxyqueuosine reductase